MVVSLVSPVGLDSSPVDLDSGGGLTGHAWHWLYLWSRLCVRLFGGLPSDVPSVSFLRLVCYLTRAVKSLSTNETFFCFDVVLRTRLVGASLSG